MTRYEAGFMNKCAEHGTGLGHLAMNTGDYLGIDPMARTVATAK